MCVPHSSRDSLVWRGVGLWWRRNASASDTFSLYPGHLPLEGGGYALFFLSLGCSEMAVTAPLRDEDTADAVTPSRYSLRLLTGSRFEAGFAGGPWGRATLVLGILMDEWDGSVLTHGPSTRLVLPSHLHPFPLLSGLSKPTRVLRGSLV